jgi:small ligand-binding sensory domain FIST
MCAAMQLVSVLSTAAATDRALAEICAAATVRLRGAAPDLVLVFVSPQHLPTVEAAAGIGAVIREQFPTALLLGVSARGVLGDAREVENQHSIALTACVLPDVELRAFHLTPDDVALYSGPDAAQRWRNLLLPAEDDTAGAPAPTDPLVLLMPDPFCPGLPGLLAGIDAAWPDGQVVGGVASGFREPGQHRLWLDDELHASGVLGLLLYGDLAADVRVAQGCHPVGQPLFVTGAREQRLLTLDGRPAVDVLQETYENAEDEDRERMRQSLFIGLGLVGRDSYGRGDFLVRHILGAEAETGALLVQGDFAESQVVQFHVRDAESSADDLRRHVESVPAGAVGAIVFACLGRGEALYGAPDFDTQLIQDAYGELPVGGFFCNGEIGAVNGRTFIHGYTASVCFLRPKSGG